MDDPTLLLLSSRPESDGGARVSVDDLAQWAGDCDHEVISFLDRIGSEIAKAYHASELSFEFCDLVVNDLWALFTQRKFDDPQGSWPSLFYEVYEAFDAGEAPLRSDAVNPVAEMTNPAIAEIVAALR